MRMWFRTLAVLTCALPVSVPAAVEIRPGLWSLTVQMAQGLELDPEFVEQMRLLGLQIPDRPVPPPREYPFCITPEQARAQRLPDLRDEGSGCTGRNLVRSGDRASGDLQCNGLLQGAGRVDIALTGSQTFTGEARFRGTSQEGLPLDLTGALSGAWRSKDCGDVQPMP